MNNHFINLIDIRNEIMRTTILPPPFWEAFVQGINPASVPDTISYHIEPYGQLMVGQGYVYSIYFQDYGYELNIVAIRDAFHISIYPIPDTTRYLGVIDYNKGKRRQELCYREKLMDRHPIALLLLQRAGDELLQHGIAVDEKVSKGALLPFEKSLKIIVCSANWLQLLTTEPNLTPRERAELIAIPLGLDPITVTGYGRFSTNKTVRYEANKAYSILLESKYDITQKWYELRLKEPALPPSMVAETLSGEMGIDPVTIAGLGRVSPEQAIKREAIDAYNTLLAAKYEITQKWRYLLDTDSSLTPRERAEHIAAEQQVDPVTIAGFGRISLDPEVRHEAHMTYKILLESKHEITRRWQHLIATVPELTPRDRAEAIALELKLDPITIAGYGCFSEDKTVKFEAHKAANSLANSKYEITQKWRTLITQEPNSTPQERASRIALELEVDPITIAIYGRGSEDLQVKSESYKAQQQLLESKHEITRKWRELLTEEPQLTPQERAERIAAAEGCDPVSIAGAGRISQDTEVKSEAIKAYGTLLASKHEITQKWRALLDTEPHLTPKERAELIAGEQGIDPITVAGYGRSSVDQGVRAEAHRAVTILSEAKHEITKQWRKLLDIHPQMTPQERAEQIAAAEGLDPITVAGYGRASPDNQVRYEANKTFLVLAGLKNEVTQKWREFLAHEPTLTPPERATRLAVEQKVDPITIAGYSRFSEDKEVKSEAIQAYSFFMNKKHQITQKWRHLLDADSSLTPRKRAETIASEEGIAPGTVAWFGRYSSDQEVRFEAHQAFVELMDSKYEITQKWRDLKNNDPMSTPQQRAEQIASGLKISAVTVAVYGKRSLDKGVKPEASRASATLMDKKHQITQKWRQLLDTEPTLTPLERAERIGAELGLDPETVAGYGKFTADILVKQDIHKARYRIRKLKETMKNKDREK